MDFYIVNGGPRKKFNTAQLLEKASQGIFDELKKNFDLHSNDYIEIGKNVPEYLMSSLSTAWLGEIDGKYYSIVMPVMIPVSEIENFKALADNKSVYFISKVNEMNKDLDRLSAMIMKLFILASLSGIMVLRTS